MPFTVSHAAAALPLKRSGLVFSALVVGSMAPDFLYFLRLPFSRDLGHSLPGLLLVDLPLGWLVLWVFHAFLKNPLFALLPLGHQRRLAPFLSRFAFSGWKRAGLISLSLLLGSLSHIAWDSFTHNNGLMVELIPALSRTLFSLRGYHLTAYLGLQYGCTLLGLAALALAYWRWYRAAPLHSVRDRAQLDGRTRLRLALVMLAGALVFGVVLGLLSMRPIDSPHQFRMMVSSVVVNAISVGGLEVLVYGVLWHAGKT